MRDNPTPLEFPISVIGAKPSVVVKLDGPQPPQPDASTTKAAGKGTNDKAKALQKAELTVQFDRLLLRKKDSHSLVISNTGILPFKWRMAGAAQLPAEFKVYPAAGELAARSDVRVTVEFTAIKKADLAELMTLEV